ncbi:MAG: HIT family protein [Candidatus Nanohaloarchaea archaeon]
MPQQQGQCPYCQLIDNPEQLLVVSETENFYAWLEIQPRARGHTQVVPKEHKESVLDFTPEEYDEAMTVVRKVIEKAEKGLGADGASVTMNIGEAGGQMLPHAYISVFPRFKDDENAGTPTGAIFPQDEEAQQQLEEIQESMSSVSVDFDSGAPKKAHPEGQRHTEEKSDGGFGSRLVDRNEVSDEEGREEKQQEEEPEADKEENRSAEEEKGGREEREQEAEEDEDELKGEGHWDGKSFEWR